MRGFILGTIATAITFAIVSYVLPAIDYGGDIRGLVIVSIIAGLVNGLIKPVVKILSFPLDHDDPRALRPRHQRRPAAAHRVAVGPDRRHLHDRRLPTGLLVRHDRDRRHRRHRHQRRRLARAAWRSATERHRPGGPPGRRASARRAAVRDAGLRHGPRRARRGGGGRARRVPRPVGPPVLGQGERRARGHRRGGRTRLRGQRRLARRMGARAAGRRPGRPDHPRGHRQDRAPTCGPRPRRPAAGAPAPLGRHRVGRRGGGARRRSSRAAGRAATRRPLPAQPGRRRPRRWPALAVGGGGVEVRDDRDRDRRRRSRPAAARTARSGRAASTSTSGRSSGPWTPGATPSGAAWR